MVISLSRAAKVQIKRVGKAKVTVTVKVTPNRLVTTLSETVVVKG